MNAYVGALLAILLLVHLAFAFAIRMKRNDLADIIWGPGFIVASIGAWLGSVNALAIDLYSAIPFICISIWAFRLCWHIGGRVLHHNEEDHRYQKMRQNWGANWVLNTYFKVFLLQGFLMLVISMPLIQFINTQLKYNSSSIAIGTLIWVFGFLFEAISDAQLKKFKLKPENKGQLMTLGFWSWSRHPNYFGEVVQWWGIFVMLVSATSWFIILSPLTITILILKISGIPLLEKTMQSKPGFLAYSKRTSIFVPWPPNGS